jgi:uncharacterized protein with von Willebrand factor type A (vWA) domain
MTAPVAPPPLADQAVRFARYLRTAGLPVAPAQTLDFVQGLTLIDLADRQVVRDAARAVFVHSYEELAVFEAAFDRFWAGGVHATRARRSVIEDLRRAAAWAPAVAEAEDLTAPPPAPQRAAAYSSSERLRTRDFGALDAEERAAVAAAILAIARRLPMRRSRRLQGARRGHVLDLRATLRAGVRTGGDPLHLARRSRRIKPRPLLLLCDVSGSMERYARILLEFAYALDAANRGSPRHVEAFVFATRLTRVTPHLGIRPLSAAPDTALSAALEAAVAAARDWGGGTRIGACLRTLRTGWGARVLSRRPIVLLISDGCDRGDIALLAAEMAHLQRRSHRLIWLNPWLGQASYTPAVRGMQAALPHVDRFLPIHNLASLEQLVATLATLDS